jgi:hypothetical protein
VDLNSNSHINGLDSDGRRGDHRILLDGAAEVGFGSRRRLRRWCAARWRAFVRTPGHELQELPYEPGWHRLWRLCRFRSPLFTRVAGGLAATVFIITMFVMKPRYQATALIRPNAQAGATAGLAGLAAMVLGGSSSGGGLSSMFGGGGGGNGPSYHDPQELIAITQSFAFTEALLADNHLESKIAKPRRGLMLRLRGPRPRWKLYKIMSRRFYCDFSVRTGNLTMTFIDRDPALARFILGQYIDRLRAQLRKEELESTKLAVKSLEDQAERSADSVLRAQLYGILAQQFELEKTAEMNADFAFEVIEAPVVPSTPYAPWRIIDPLAVGFLLSLIIVAYLFLRDRYVSLKREMDLVATASSSSLKLVADRDRLEDNRARSIS